MATTELAQEVEAARYLNIRVALRVMGWTQWKDLSQDCPYEPGVTYFADWADSDGGVSVYLPEGDGDPAFYFNPAASLIDAWQLIERFAAEQDSQRRYWFGVRLRWAIEDRTETHCLESEVILRVKPADICKAALDSFEKDLTAPPPSRLQAVGETGGRRPMEEKYVVKVDLFVDGHHRSAYVGQSTRLYDPASYVSAYAARLWKRRASAERFIREHAEALPTTARVTSVTA